MTGLTSHLVSVAEPGLEIKVTPRLGLLDSPTF